MGRPLKSTSVGYIRPSETLALCEIASRSLPILRWPSIHVHRSSGNGESSALKGASGTLPQSLKKTFRCMFMLFGIDVHSYEQNAVNLPGWLAWSAFSMVARQTLPAISGDASDLMGGPPISTLTP